MAAAGHTAGTRTPGRLCPWQHLAVLAALAALGARGGGLGRCWRDWHAGDQIRAFDPLCVVQVCLCCSECDARGTRQKCEGCGLASGVGEGSVR